MGGRYRAAPALIPKKFSRHESAISWGFVDLILHNPIGGTHLMGCWVDFGTSVAPFDCPVSSLGFRAASPLPKKSHRVLERSIEAPFRTPAALLDLLNPPEFASVRRQRRYPAARLQCPPHCAGRGILFSLAPGSPLASFQRLKEFLQ